MKTILRNTLVYALLLYFLPLAVPGVQITGGIITLFVGGFGLALMFMLLKPVLTIISFPINLITLGFFSLLTNAFIIYILTFFLSDVTIDAFNYPGFEFSGFVIPKINFNTFFAYVYAAFLLSFSDSFIKWLID